MAVGVSLSGSGLGPGPCGGCLGGWWRFAVTGGDGVRCLRVAGSGGLGRQNPDSCRESEAAADEVAQVQAGGAAFEPGVVLGGAAVAQFEASAAQVGDLGDDPFHVGSERAVLLA